MSSENIYILGIESSCDDTSAAVICNGKVLSNIVANQEVHAKYCLLYTSDAADES